MGRVTAADELVHLIAHYNYTLCLRSCGLSEGDDLDIASFKGTTLHLLSRSPP